MLWFAFSYSIFNNWTIIYSFNRLISVFISISLNCNFSINFFVEYLLKIFVSDVTDGTSKDVEHYHWNGLTHAKLRMKWRATFRMDEMKGKIKDEMKRRAKLRMKWRAKLWSKDDHGGNKENIIGHVLLKEWMKSLRHSLTYFF